MEFAESTNITPWSRRHNRPLSFISSGVNLGKRPQGAILIEFLIANAITLALVSVLTLIYLVAINAEQSIIELQHIVRVATSAHEILFNNIMQAGYIGCPRLTNNFPV